jgi:putative endonuclease
VSEKEETVFYVYVLQNPAGRFYVGQTRHLLVRVEQHNETGPSMGKYTLKNGPWELVWFERHPTRSSAVRRERQIKRMRSARWIKENLISPSSATARGRTSPARRD